jgi:hypothetical protein
LNAKGLNMPDADTRAKTAHARAVDARRRAVAMLTLRGMTQREVEQNLPRLDPPVVNPGTGKPYSLGTINGDLQKLSREWREQAGKDTDQLKADHLARVAEVRRSAWQKGHLNVIMRALEHEAKLLGFAEDRGADEPPSVSVSVNVAGGDGGFGREAREIREIDDHIRQLELEIEEAEAEEGAPGAGEA